MKKCDFYTEEDNTCDIDKECYLLCNGNMSSEGCLFRTKDLEIYKKVVTKENVEQLNSYFKRLYREYGK